LQFLSKGHFVPVVIWQSNHLFGQTFFLKLLLEPKPLITSTIITHGTKAVAKNQLIYFKEKA